MGSLAAGSLAAAGGWARRPQAAVPPAPAPLPRVPRAGRPPEAASIRRPKVVGGMPVRKPELMKSTQPAESRAVGSKQDSERRQNSQKAKDPATLLSYRISDAKNADKALWAIADALDSPALNGVHLSNGLSKLANTRKSLNKDPGDVFDRLLTAIHEALAAGNVDERGVANMFHATAALRDDLPEVRRLLPRLVEAGARSAAQMKPQELANVAWACATLKLEQPMLGGLMKSVAASLERQKWELNALDLSNVLFAATVMRNAAPEFVGVVPHMAEVLLEAAPDMNPDMLTAVLKAMATFREEAPGFLKALPMLLACVVEVSKSFRPNQAADLLAAVAALRKNASGLHEQMTPLLRYTAQLCDWFNPPSWRR